jgi:hypothetical protein
MFTALPNARFSFSLLKCFSFLVLLLCGVPAFAGVQLDATSTQVGVQGSTSLTWTHTLGNGGNRMVVCGVTYWI